MTFDRDQFLEDGFLIVREAIPPDELEAVRSAYEVLVDRQRKVWARDRKPSDPPGGLWDSAAQPRLNLGAMASLIDEHSAKAVETWLFPEIHSLSSALLDVPDAAGTEMMLMCNPVRDHGPARWHRDMYPPLCAPIRGYIDEILGSGPRYVQWNITLYYDDTLWVVPGSHKRINTPEEDAQILEDPHAPVPGGIQTRLKAGDGVVYILPILHWGSNYSTKRRRCIHGGFSMFSQYEDLSYLDFLSEEAQAAFQRWDRRSEDMKDQTEAALRTFMNGDIAGYFAALDRLHPGRGEKGQVLSTVFLSKTARRIDQIKRPGNDRLSEQEQGWATRSHPMTLQWGTAFADRFTTQGAALLWKRFKPVDAMVRSDDMQFAPSFQGADWYYHFIDMPASENILEII
ncbi:MAG: phytanoyl-CoA dioxygenase family protein [Gemmatimonadota bacterium]|nr:phytanoyl-CoA dioxygenase family protein [Gemmatimonadota bacterium]